MKKLSYIVFISLTALLLNSCFLLTSPTKTISGTIYEDTSNLVIGAFPNNYDFNGGASLGSEHEVYSESGAADVFSPLTKGIINSTSKTYTLTLPDDPSQMGDLIAWVDTGLYPGLFQMNDSTSPPTGERAYLPVKTINGNKYIVEIVSYGSGYAYEYNDGTGTKTVVLEDYNSGGFNFYIGVSPGNY